MSPLRSLSVVCQGANCDELDFYRASGDCICPVCGADYRHHPYCANSELPESMQSGSVNKGYHLHVLCNGDHVHL